MVPRRLELLALLRMRTSVVDEVTVALTAVAALICEHMTGGQSGTDCSKIYTKRGNLGLLNTSFHIHREKICLGRYVVNWGVGNGEAPQN